MKYWNTRLKEMSEYIPGEQPKGTEGIIKLNTNENPFPPSEPVMETLRKRVNGDLRRYPDPVAWEVRNIFARQNDLAPEQIFVANGSDEIFTLLFRGFIDFHETCAFPYPSYSLYDTLAEMNGIPFEKIPLNKDFTLDFDRFLEKEYRMVLIANPNNPTGTYTSLDEIESFLKQYSGLLVVDEAYIDFYGGSALQLISQYDNLVVTRSFSKSYSLAGMRIGIAIANEEIIKGFMRIKDSYNLDTLAQAAAVAALKEEEAFRYNITMLRNNKEYLEECLAGMGFEVTPSQANFLFVRHPRVEAATLYRSLKEQNILVRHFTGPIQEEYIRISIGTMMELKKLCKALEAICGAE